MHKLLLILLFVIFSALLFPVAPISAHPHVFIDNYVTFSFDHQGLAGIRQKWIFDEMTSSTFLMDYDVDHNGQLNKAEVQQLKSEAFDNLKNYAYMTFVTINNQAFPVQFIKDFKAYISHDKLTYEFLVPCHVTAQNTDKTIVLSIYDEEYFIDFNYHYQEITTENPENYQTSIATAKNKQISFYMDQFHPLETTLKFRKTTK